MNEHSWTRGFRTDLRKVGGDTYEWKINDNFTNGVPDLFLEGITRDLWVEIKYITLPKREKTIVRPYNLLSGNQKLWLDRRYARRQDAILLLGTDKGAVILTGGQWANEYSDGELALLATSRKTCAKKLYSFIHHGAPL